MKHGTTGKRSRNTVASQIDIPPLTRAQLERMRPLPEVHPKAGQKLRAPSTGKTKITIRLDNAVLDYFRALVDAAGGGNYQTLINDALVDHIRQRSVLDAVRQVVREELRKSA